MWIAGWTFISELGVVVQGDFMGPDTAVRAEESSLSSAVPGAFELGNSPNPFNPSTTIQYFAARGRRGHPHPLQTAPVRSWTTLVEGYRGSGIYSVQLSGDELASGTYHYRLISPNGILSRSATLLK